MLILQQILAVPMLLTVIWLMWVLYAQITVMHWLFTMLFVCVFVCFLLDIVPIASKRFKRYGYPLILVCLGFVFLQWPYQKKTMEIYSVAALDELLAKGDQKILVDVTARWCLTCKVNEKLVLNKPEIQKWLADQDITFWVLDWTQQNEDITAYLQRFEREGVPLYVYYNKKGDAQVLPQVLSQELIKKLD